MILRLVFIVLCLVSLNVHSALKPLDAVELSSVSAAGISLQIEDFQVITDVAGINNGTNVPTTTTNLVLSDFGGTTGEKITLSNLYLVKKNGNTTQASSGNGVNIGSNTAPFKISIPKVTNTLIQVYDSAQNKFVAGTADKSVLSLCLLAADCTDPTNIDYGSEQSDAIDFGALINFDANTVSDQDIWLKAEGLKIKGSSVNIWPDRAFGLSLSARLRFSADALSLSPKSGVDNQGDFSDAVSFKINNIEADIVLGHPFYQPLNLSSQKRFRPAKGGIPAATVSEIQIAIAPIPNEPTIYNKFYDPSTPKTNISTGDVVIQGQNLGYLKVEDLQIQGLRITTHDVIK